MIGVPSFGKGSAQSVLPISPDGEIVPYAFNKVAGKWEPEGEVAGTLKVTSDAFFAGKSGLSNQGSGIIPNVRVIYNDVRDEAAKDARHEADLQNALVSKERTRAGNKPEEVCTLKTEFAGPLSDEQLKTIPAYMVMDYRIRNEKTDTFDKVKLLDADVDCATDNQYTTVAPFTPPAP